MIAQSLTEEINETVAGIGNASIQQFLVEREAVAPVPTNVIETWGSYVVQMALPGVILDTLQVKVVARTLIVEGRFSAPAFEGGTCVTRGIPSGEFHQELDLPGRVDQDAAHARYDRGVLTVELPTVAHLHPTTVPISLSA